jgi:hypothetical protein
MALHWSDQANPFFVTAQHVLFDSDGNRHTNLFLRMNKKKTGLVSDFNVIRANAWFFHESNEAVDIAVQPLYPNKADILYIKIIFYPPISVSKSLLSAVKRNVSVATVKIPVRSRRH